MQASMLIRLYGDRLFYRARGAATSRTFGLKRKGLAAGGARVDCILYGLDLSSPVITPAPVSEA